MEAHHLWSISMTKCGVSRNAIALPTDQHKVRKSIRSSWSCSNPKGRSNGTGNVVNSFYASNIKRTSWEEDILGKGVLQPGQRVTVNIDDGSGACLFDFRAVLANGRKVEARRVDVCQVSSWTIR